MRGRPAPHLNSRSPHWRARARAPDRHPDTNSLSELGPGAPIPAARHVPCHPPRRRPRRRLRPWGGPRAQTHGPTRGPQRPEAGGRPPAAPPTQPGRPHPPVHERRGAAWGGLWACKTEEGKRRGGERAGGRVGVGRVGKRAGAGVFTLFFRFPATTTRAPHLREPHTHPSARTPSAQQSSTQKTKRMIHALRTSTTPLAAARNGPRLAGQAAPRPPFAAAPLLYRRWPPSLVGESVRVFASRREEEKTWGEIAGASCCLR